MLDFILEDRIPHFFCPFFVDKLGRVTSHEDNRVLSGKFLFQELEIGQHVQAIDATVCPKINEDELAAEVPLNCQWLRIEPRVIMRELLGLRLCLLLHRYRIHLLQIASHGIQISLSEDVVAGGRLVALKLS